MASTQRRGLSSRLLNVFTIKSERRPSTPPTQPITLRKDLGFVDRRILKRLQRYDLCDHVLSVETSILGRGAFSDVFRGVCRDSKGKEVKIAIKRLRLHVNAEECKRLFEKEIYVWSKLVHVNLLPFMGYAFEAGTGYPMLISEWMDDGNAFTYVKEYNPPIERIFDIIFDVAQGIEYLHHEDRIVIHSDIKPENIVINPDGVAMLCDFGCARTEVATCSIAAPTAANSRGTCRYWAPELFERFDDVMTAHTVHTDIWAFGMTIYVLCTKLLPYSNYAELAVPLAIIRRELPTFSDGQPSQKGGLLQSIAHECWKPTPSERSNASVIASKLHRARLFDCEGSSSSSDTLIPNSPSTGVPNTLSDVPELEQRIRSLQDEVERRPPGYPDRDLSLSDLGDALNDRYLLYRKVSDTEQIIGLHHEALELRPPGHPGRGSTLFNLGRAFSDLSGHRDARENLDKSISFYEKALEIRQPGHPNRDTTLHGLGHVLGNRYADTKDPSDLEKCIQLRREVLELRPPGHQHRASTLRYLVMALDDRYELLGNIADREESVRLNAEALSLHP